MDLVLILVVPQKVRQVGLIVQSALSKGAQKERKTDSCTTRHVQMDGNPEVRLLESDILIGRGLSSRSRYIVGIVSSYNWDMKLIETWNRVGLYQLMFVKVLNGWNYACVCFRLFM